MKIRQKMKQMLAGLLTLATVMTMGFPAEVFAEPSENITVTVSVYDYAAVDAGLVTPSEVTAGETSGGEVTSPQETVEPGVVFENVKITVPADATAAAAISQAADKSGIDCELSEYGYIESINGLANDYGNNCGWYSSINGDFNAYALFDGADIRADYSVANGEDINNGWDYSDYPNSKEIPPTLTSFTVAGKTLDSGTLSSLTGEGTEENPYVITMTYNKGTELTSQTAAYETTLNSHYVKFQTGNGLANPDEALDYSEELTFCLTGTLGSAATYYTVSPFNMSVTVPSKAELFVGEKTKHYLPFKEVEYSKKTVHADETTTYQYILASGQTYNYRVSGEGYLTYGNKFTVKSGMEPIAITEEQLTGDAKEIDHDVTGNSGYNVADIYLNINDQNYLQLNQGETYQIVNLRNWEAVDTIINNYFIEPDYHYTVIDENGNASDVVTVDENGVITANTEGTAIVLVTYDAMTVYDNFYSAIWPENTGVFVVSVGAEESGIDLNMLLNEENETDESLAGSKLSGKKVDAELDVFYYKKGEAGAYYSFTPTEGSEVTLLTPTVTDSALTYQGGFGSDGVTKQGDTYTVCLKQGRNIVKVTKDGKSEYQVLTAKEVSYQIKNVTNPGQEIMPGDTVTVTFDTVYHPVNKLAGVYNMSAKLLYTAPESVTVAASANQYAFASKAQTLTVTIPEDYNQDTVTLTEGKIYVSGFGDPYGNHRGITYTEGKNPNFTAQMRKADFAVLPDVEIPVLTNEAKAEREAKADAAEVDTLIGKIGTVTVNSKSAIDAARAAYDSLSSLAKTYVTKLNVLTEAEKAYRTLTIKEPEPVKVSKLKLNKTESTLLVKQTAQLTATVEPENADNKKVTWTSSKPSVATVSSSGKVTAKKAGTTVISALAADGSGVKAVCTITVKKPTVKFNVTTLTIQEKKSSSVLKASGLQKNDSIASYTSSNPKVVTVSKSGKLTAKKVGTAKIRVKTKYGATATCTVKVQEKQVITKSIKVAKSSLIVKRKKTVSIVVTRNPISATDKITYTSSNKKIATVSGKGVIKGIKKGSCKITIKAAGGAKKTIKVTVK